MFRNTRFADLLKGIQRENFQKTADSLESDKHCKGFSCWDHLIAMVFAQLSGSRSLREIEAGFNEHQSSHYHLGTDKIKRSTLSDANAKRSPELFEELCKHLMTEVHRKLRGELKDLLYLLDATPIPLKGQGYDDWAKANKSNLSQGLKVHMLFAANISAPLRAEITAPNINDIEIGREFDIERGGTYVFDKGYYDYSWWHKIAENKAKFVTRFKKNAGLKEIKYRHIPKNAEGIVLEDAVVEFKHERPGGKENKYYGKPLRRIVIDRPDKKTPIVLATNDLQSSALTIGRLYKRRWEIELFFKWLKQNLKIKKFLGRSENAVRIQIYTALISYLLVHSYKKRNELKASLKLVLATLRTGLFQRPETDHVIARRQRKLKLEYETLQGVLAL